MKNDDNSPPDSTDESLVQDVSDPATPKDTPANEPMIGERRWYKDAYAIIALAASLIGIVTGLVALYKWLERPPEPVGQNVEIVMDNSAQMNDPFDGGTKRDAAMQAVSDYLHGLVTKAVADEDNLAFRVFGGDCSGENTRMVVDFDQENTTAIENAARAVKPGGQSALVNAVVRASSDFNGPQFKGVTKRIIVITGGSDACAKDDAVKIIQTRMADVAKQSGEKVELNFRFIGVGLSPEQQAQLDILAKATGGEANFVGTKNELNRAVTRFLRVEPVTKDMQSITDILDAVVILGNEAIGLSDSDYDKAQAKLVEAQRTLEKSDSQFKDLGQHQGKDQFQPLFEEMYRLAKANRETQVKVLQTANTMIEQRKRGEKDTADKTHIELVKFEVEYNSHLEEIVKLRRQVEDTLQQAYR